MKLQDVTRGLVVVGALNWGLVGAAKLDLVATLTGKRFGGTNIATRLIYLAVGAAAVAEAIDLGREISA